MSVQIVLVAAFWLGSMVPLCVLWSVTQKDKYSEIYRRNFRQFILLMVIFFTIVAFLIALTPAIFETYF